jgi:hypothetical protein
VILVAQLIVHVFDVLVSGVLRQSHILIVVLVNIEVILGIWLLLALAAKETP